MSGRSTSSHGIHPRLLSGLPGGLEAADGPDRVFLSPTHRLARDGADESIPAIGADHAVHVPNRREVRPIATSRYGQLRYRYTLLRSDFQVRIDEVEDLGEEYAVQVRAIVATPALASAIRQARAAGSDHADPVLLPTLPPYAAEITPMVCDLLAAEDAFPASPVRAFLGDRLAALDALNRFNRLAPFLSSSARPGGRRYTDYPKLPLDVLRGL